MTNESINKISYMSFSIVQNKILNMERLLSSN